MDFSAHAPWSSRENDESDSDTAEHGTERRGTSDKMIVSYVWNLVMLGDAAKMLI